MDISLLVQRAREVYRATKNAQDEKIVEYENTINARATTDELNVADRIGILRKSGSHYYLRLA